jgi:hypothetical protein
MTNITYNDLSDFLRHANNGANETEFDSNIDSPIIISQIELSSQIADYLNEEILEESQVEAIDILDVLASLGIVLSSLAKDVHRHNYASIAHSYAINPNILPEISQHLS